MSCLRPCCFALKTKSARPPIKPRSLCLSYFFSFSPHIFISPKCHRFSTEDVSHTWQISLPDFEKLRSMKTFQLLNHGVNNIYSSLDENDVPRDLKGAISAEDRKKFVDPFTIPRSRIPGTRFAFELSYQGPYRIGSSDINAGTKTHHRHVLTLFYRL